MDILTLMLVLRIIVLILLWGDGMNGDEIKEYLGEIDENMLIADDLDDALIGYVEGINRTTVALYDRNKCIQILMERDGMTDEEAVEHFEFNIGGAYVGEYTPAFATLLRPDE